MKIRPNNKIKELRLENENRELKKVLRTIFSAKTFKVWQSYCHLRDRIMKLLFKKNEFRHFIISRYIKIKKIIKDKTNPFILYIEIPKTIKTFKNVSIVIPTYNGADYFPNLIKAIKMQRNVINPEIIFVDSESTDETLRIAKESNIKVITIKQAEFNHGLARNIGAENARGDYIIFTVQDALPADNYTYSNMLSILESNKNVVGVSTKQIPYPDADLFARWQIYMHNSALELVNINYISHIPKNGNFYKLPFFEKRKISLYDDVCSCVRKSDFFALGEYQKINFAEDIEFSIRALIKGYKIAYTGNSGVIHSHTRPTEYFLKRYYADNKVVNKLFKEANKPEYHEVKDILQSCYVTYLYIYKYVSNYNFKFRMPDFDAFKDNIKNIRLPSNDSQILKILIRLSKLLNVKLIKSKNLNLIDKIIYEQFKNIFNDSTKLLSFEKYDSVKIKLFCDKLFTSIVGGHLTAYASKHKTMEAKLDKILLKGI